MMISRGVAIAIRRPGTNVLKGYNSLTAGGAVLLMKGRLGDGIGFSPRRNFSLEDFSERVENFFNGDWEAILPKPVEDASSEFISHGIANGYSPVSFAQWALEGLHVSTGAPWWLSLMMFGAGMRMLCFPLQVIEKIKKEKMEPFQGEYQRETMRLKKLRKDGKSKEAMAGFEALRALKSSRGHWNDTRFSVLMIMQGAIMITSFMAVNGISNSLIPSWCEGGMAWFPDLSQPDIYLFLPGLYAGVSTCITFVNARLTSPGPMFQVSKYLMIVLFPLYMHLSAASTLYLISMRVSFLLSTMAVVSNPIRRLVGMKLKPKGKRVCDLLIPSLATRNTSLPPLVPLSENNVSLQQQQQQGQSQYKKHKLSLNQNFIINSKGQFERPSFASSKSGDPQYQHQNSLLSNALSSITSGEAANATDAGGSSAFSFSTWYYDRYVGNSAKRMKVVTLPDSSLTSLKQ